MIPFAEYTEPASVTLLSKERDEQKPENQEKLEILRINERSNLGILNEGTFAAILSTMANVCMNSSLELAIPPGIRNAQIRINLTFFGIFDLLGIRVILFQKLYLNF